VLTKIVTTFLYTGIIQNLRDVRSDGVTDEDPRLLGYDTEQTGLLKAIEITQGCDQVYKMFIHMYLFMDVMTNLQHSVLPQSLEFSKHKSVLKFNPLGPELNN
jgi:hypothetical protein